MLKLLLTQLFRRQSRNAAPLQTVSAHPTETHTSAPMDMDGLIRYAAKQADTQLHTHHVQKITDWARHFDAHVEGVDSDMHIFVFHAHLENDEQQQYRPLAGDISQYDYMAVLRVFKECVRRWRPKARIFLVTADDSFDELGDDRLSIVKLKLDKNLLMYERVYAMCAYVHSQAFAHHTMFLDSDAFLTGDFQPYFDLNFDVGVTYRNQLGLMPVNEGVILAKCDQRSKVQLFFDKYLATFESLCDDSLLRKNFGDIRQWWGGQLSLNIVSKVAAPFMAMHAVQADGFSLLCLPCDAFNYSFEYGQPLSAQLFDGKKVVHLKGARKSTRADWVKLSETLGRGVPARSYVRPLYVQWNKEYSTGLLSDPSSRAQFVRHVERAALVVDANQPGSNALLADDLFVWFKSVHFLEDAEFQKALGPLFDDQTLRARIWRLYTLCWAARSCMSIDGDYLDVGCYDGKTVSVVERYCKFSEQNIKTYWLYDMFEDPPTESRKSGHGPELFHRVRQQFSFSDNFRVTKGAVPASFDGGNLPSRVAFAHIDLNVAEPELQCLERIFDLITPGGMIIFDDFGGSRYRKSMDLERAFMAQHGQAIYECPTGQGIFIKR